MNRTLGPALSLLVSIVLLLPYAPPARAGAGDLVWYFQGIQDVYAIDDIEDVDGDGVKDIVVESYDAGAVGDHLSCLSGASAGPTAGLIWSTQPAGGPSSSGGYGNECMTVAPDMTGDGHEDVLLGTAWGGRTAYLLNGNDGGVHYDFDTYVDTPPVPATSGWVYTIKPVPDVDGDASPDCFFATGSYNDGAYCVSPIEGIVLWYQYMGDAVFSCATLDDVNGDGRSDGAFGVGENADAVWVVAGGGGPAANVVWTVPMPGSVQVVERIADISGDGVNDVLAGTWTSAGNVYALSGVNGAVLWTAPLGSYQYIMRLVALDDVDGDGYEDVAVGSWDNRAVVLSGIDGSVVWDTRVGTLNGGDVWSVGRVADVNGDGINDVVAGSFDYNVYLFDGTTGDSLWWYNTGHRLYFVNGVDDITGNGRPDVVAGTQMLTDGPPGGRAYLLEGGDISTGVEGPSIVARAEQTGGGVRAILEGAFAYVSCHVERIRSGSAEAVEAESFKRELTEAVGAGEMTQVEAIAARSLTPGPSWVRLTSEPLEVVSGRASYLDESAEPGTAYEYRFVLLTPANDALYSPTARVVLPGDPSASSALPLSVHPNPMNPATTIDFSLREAGPVEVGVFGANGRLLARVWEGDRPAGTTRLDWNGRGDDGRPLPSGLYFVRVESREGASVRKLAVVR